MRTAILSPLYILTGQCYRYTNRPPTNDIIIMHGDPSISKMGCETQRYGWNMRVITDNFHDTRSRVQAGTDSRAQGWLGASEGGRPEAARQDGREIECNGWNADSPTAADAGECVSGFDSAVGEERCPWDV